MASEPVDGGGIDGFGENQSFRVYTRKGKGQRKQAPYFAEAIGEKPEEKLENGKENAKENNLVNPPETLAREPVDSIAVERNSIEETNTETISHEEVKSSIAKNSIEAVSENLPDNNADIVIDKPLVEALSQSQLQDDVNTIVGEKSVEIPSQSHVQDDVNTVVVDENSIKEPLISRSQEDVVTVIVDKSPIKAPSQTLSMEDVYTIVVDKNPIEVSSEEHIHVVDEDNLIKEVHRENLVEQDAQQPAGSMPMEEGVDGRIMLHLPSISKQQKDEIRKTLEEKLNLVRNLVRKIEAKEVEISADNDSRVLVNTITNNGGGRILSGFASAGLPREVVRSSRPLNQLSISVLENTQGTNELMEREKRTPKANQFYRTSEFLLGDKLPPAESTKKPKSSAKKQGRENMLGFGAGSKIFKNCSALLERLMKNKHGWVFNAPVDVKGLGLHDYFIIIKNPMDLGTVKSNLTKNLYKSPRDFAEDVRLTFHNAMTYNPQGQDVHVMAEELLQVFEERWAVIEADYLHELRFVTGYEINLPNPTMRSRLGPKMLPPPINVRNTFNRADWSSSHHTDPQHPKPTTTPGRTPSSATPYGRQPALRKPKANEPNKRDMTPDEKQKLSANLQNLAPDKLDTIVQIINKRNTAVKLRDEEIEVDIDVVDPETLWELDRFVINYKKGLSKKRRKAELAIQARAEVERNNQLQMALAPVAHEHRVGGTTAKKTLPPHLSSQAEKPNTETSSSSSGSSSDSSSSSDSDSDSSSSSGSDQT